MMAAAREVLAFAIWIVLALPSGVLYAWFLAALGRDLAWIAGAIVVVLPAAVMLAGLALWLPALLYLRHRRRARLGWRAPAIAAAQVAVAGLVLAGPQGFWLNGSDPLLVWWIAALAAGAAFLHDRWSRIWLAPREAAT